MVADIIAGYAALVATAAILITIWQARRGRYPRIDLELIHTRGPNIRMVTLEVRNRGDYPVRVVTAGISSLSIINAFRPDGIEIAHSHDGYEEHIRFKSDDQEVTSTASSDQMSPLPGIILPRDAGSRFIVDKIAFDISAAKKVSPELVNDLIAFTEQELRGWVSVSTGEVFSSKPVKFDWENFKKI